MLSLTWRLISTFTPQPPYVAMPWLMAHEELGGATTYLKLKAEGRWTPFAGLDACGPDGLTGQAFPDDRLFLTDCPVGALIGRIGGSSASLRTLTPAADAGEGKPFPVGHYTLLKLPDNVVGPLFLGFNILARPIRLDELKVEIWGGS